MTRRRKSPARAALAVYIVFIVYGTSLPFEYQGWQPDRIRWQLFRDPDGSSVSRTDVISNLLLFVPLGFLLLVAVGRRVPWVALRGVITVGLGAAVSLLVEVLQIPSATRVPSVTDLCLNAAGCALGWIAAELYVARFEKPVTQRLWRAWQEEPRRVLGWGTALVIAFVSLSPFNVSIDWSDVKFGLKTANLRPFHEPPVRPVQRKHWTQVFRELAGRSPIPQTQPQAWHDGRIDWTYWVKQSPTLLLFGVLGFFMVRSRTRDRQRPAVLAFMSTGCWAVALALGLEVLQLALPGSITDVTDVALAALGVGLGALSAGAYALAVDPNPAEHARPTILLALTVYILWLVLDGLYPFEFSRSLVEGWQQLTPRRLLPLLAHFESEHWLAVLDLAGQVLRFVPLGFLWFRAEQPSAARRSPPARAMTAGFVVSLCIEIAQLTIPARTFDLTDAVAAALGAWLGVRAALYCSFD